MMIAEKQFPKDKGLDQTFNLLTEGYLFIQNRCKQLGTNVFQTRVMGMPVICMTGKDAVKVFYNNEKFQRKGAAPKRIQQSLFGVNGIQSMDDEAHKHRKEMFMSLMKPERLELLNELTRKQFKIQLSKWIEKDKIILFEEMKKLLYRVACQWAGIPFKESEVDKRSEELYAMVDAFGAIGPRHWEGRIARNKSESWIKSIIIQIRSGKLKPDNDSPAYIISTYQDNNGKLLSNDIAAIEVLNILRPIVAIANYITFGALSLHNFPETKDKIISSREYIGWFVQEVRRFYPFGPFLGAKVRNDFKWQGYNFKQGTLVFLDIYGTNHDPSIWENPDSFLPERFQNWYGNPYELIPQGGGDYYKDHRCAGESVTVEIMKTSLDFLANKMMYEVPAQDLSYSLTRMPSMVKSGFIMKNISAI